MPSSVILRQAVSGGFTDGKIPSGTNADDDNATGNRRSAGGMDTAPEPVQPPDYGGQTRPVAATLYRALNRSEESSRSDAGSFSNIFTTAG